MTEPKAPMEEAVKEAVEVLTALRSATAFDPEDAQMSQVEKYLCARAQRGIDTALAALNPTVCLALIARARDAERLERVAIDVMASLAAAISLLERSPKTAAPSNKMFNVMLDDYRASLKSARQALSALNEGGPANG